jgi:hypothetical protein
VGARIWDLYASVTFVSLVLHKSDTEGWMYLGKLIMTKIANV